jgi:hypothetical protein
VFENAQKTAKQATEAAQGNFDSASAAAADAVAKAAPQASNKATNGNK